MDKDYNVLGRPIVGLSGIQRFSRRLKVRSENVAEHMWYVSYFTMELCKEYDVGFEVTLLALKYAICHDIPEIILDDVNHDVKELFPDMKRQLEKQEDALFRDIDHDVYYTHIATTDNLPSSIYIRDMASIAHLIVDLADVHSVMCYIQSEIRLGNTFFFKEALSETIIRLEECEKKLKEGLTHVG